LFIALSIAAESARDAILACDADILLESLHHVQVLPSVHFPTDVNGARPMLKLTRWTIAHRRLVVVSWLAVAVSVFAVAQSVGNRSANDFALPNTDSQRAIDLLQSRFPAQAGDSDQIVFHTRNGKLTDASTRAVIAPLLGRIARLPHVSGVVSPYD